MTLVGRAIDCTTSLSGAAAPPPPQILGNARNFHLDQQICANFKPPAKLPPPLLSNAPVLFIIDGAFHETLPRDDVQKLVVDWFKSESRGADRN